MSEKQWIASTNSEEMLRLLHKRKRVSARKLRLFACACLWQEEAMVSTFPERLRILDSVERWCDGAVGPDEVAAAQAELGTCGDDMICHALYFICEPDVWAATSRAEHAVPLTHSYGVTLTIESSGPIDYLGTPEQAALKVRVAQAVLLRDIFGEQYRPVRFAPTWLTPTVAALAGAIYADRAWDRMPILADALEEAGCADARVLDHCRAYPVHARGCWVVDAILGKS